MRIANLVVMACATAAAAPAAAQPLSRTEISRGVRAIRPASDACLRHAGVAEAVVVRFDILNGRAVNVRVRDGRSAACLAAAVQKARFRRSSQRITIAYPFLLSRSAPGRVPAPPRGPSLSREQVSVGIRSIRAAVSRCRRSPARTLVKVRLEIEKRRVVRARGTSDTADSRTIACVERAAAQATFPSAAPTAVHYPFLLH